MQGIRLAVVLESCFCRRFRMAYLGAFSTGYIFAYLIQPPAAYMQYHISSLLVAPATGRVTCTGSKPFRSIAI